MLTVAKHPPAPETRPMLPTRTTVLLFLLGLLLVPLAVFYPAGYWLLFGYDACVGLLFVADALLAFLRFRSGALRVRRERPAGLSLGVDNEVVLVLDNPTGRGFRVVARDEPPPAFRAEPNLLPATVPPHGWVRLAYRLLPTERGNFSFGSVHLRVR